MKREKIKLTLIIQHLDELIERCEEFKVNRIVKLGIMVVKKHLEEFKEGVIDSL